MQQLGDSRLIRGERESALSGKIEADQPAFKESAARQRERIGQPEPDGGHRAVLPAGVSVDDDAAIAAFAMVWGELIGRIPGESWSEQQ